MKRLRFSLFIALAVLIILCLVFSFSIQPSFAQTSPFDWSNPEQITQSQEAISEPDLVADQSGRVHLFWAPFSSESQSLYYSQFTSIGWTDPVDIFTADQIGGPSAVVDSLGIIHLIWNGDNTVYYSQATVDEAHSAVSWTTPIAIDNSNKHGRILTATNSPGEPDKLYIVYAGLSGSGPQFVASEDGGANWSEPVTISLTESSNTSADYVAGAISSDGTIHIVWTEFKLPQGWPPLGVYYSHSNDDGQTWSRPLQMASGNYDQINIAVFGDSVVHVAWNGAAGTGGRYHRWSQDGGDNWATTNVVVPIGVGGTEGPPQLAVDSLGTLHLVTTYDQRVWYSYFQSTGGGRWSEPIYVPSGDEAGIPPVGQSIDVSKTRHIESPTMTINQGNRLHLVFWDERPSQQIIQYWYTTKQTSAGSTPLQPFPTPTISPTRHAVTNRTDASATNITPSPAFDLSSGPDTSSANPGWPILIAVLPVILIITSVVIFRLARLKGR